MLGELHLTDWMGWGERSRLPDSSGIYVIGRGEKHDTIYIGRTWASGGLRDRVRAFNRSATTGQKGHAGGVTFHAVLGPDTSGLLVRVHVPVAVNPVETILRPYIEYAERRMIWEHVARHGCLPVCNSE